MDDEAMIELFVHRSEKAIEALDEAYGGLCKRIALHILNNNENAEEVLNDTYLAVWNAIPPEHPKRLISYVCKIARNLALKQYNRNTAVKRNSYYDTALEEIADTLADKRSVEADYDTKELGKAINCFLSGLEQTERMIFVRRYWYTDAIEDIAADYGTSRNNITVKLHRTRNKLKDYLKEAGYYE